MLRQRNGRNALQNAMNAVVVVDDAGQTRGDVQSDNPWALNFIATRESNTILDALYFCLFGTLNSPTSYYRVLSKLELLPVVGGVVGSVAWTTEVVTGDLLFTYTLGAGTDILRVHSKGRNSASEWTEMIRSGASFSSHGFRETYDKDNFDTQFLGISVETAINTAKGISAQDSYQIDPTIDPDQFKDKRFDAMLKMDVDAYYTLANGFVSNTNALYAQPSIGMYFFDPIWDMGGAFDRSQC
jgi:hypothetical protein